MKRLTRALLRQFARAARPYLESHGLLRTSKVFNNSALVWEPGSERVVVLAPHMDDETIGCGGTLARHVQAGAEVRVVFLTDGRHGSGRLKDLGGEALAAEEFKLIRTRQEEARRALEILGVQAVSFLEVEDGTLERDAGVATRLRGILEAERPELVYVPCFLEQQHPDHYSASRILLEATEASSLGIQCMAYEVWTPLFPNCVVRIDEVIELKRSALVYRSQLADLDYLHSALALNAYRSAAFTGDYGRFAEAFYSVPVREYRAMFDRYRGGV